MSTLPSSEEKGRMALKIFAHFGTRPGEVLLRGNFVAVSADWGWRINDVADGLDYGLKAGWFEGGPNNSVKLTDAGFAAI